MVYDRLAGGRRRHSSRRHLHLVNYLPTRSKLPFLILGFLLAAYVKIPLIGVAGFGLVITLLDYMYTRQADQRWAAIRQGGDLDE